MKVRRALQGTALLALAATAALMLVPPLFGLERYVVTGGSMGSAVPRGSIVYERRVRTTELRVGDVITYRPPAQEQRLTHRIVWIGPDHDAFRTRGDSNPAPDPWTFTLPAKEQPKAVFHVPLAGYVIAALSIKAVRMAAIGGPALAIAVATLATLGRPRRKSPIFG